MLLCLVLVSASATRGQPKQVEKKDGPRVALAFPLGITPGKTSRVTIRGLKLDKASEIRFPDTGIKVKVLSKGPAAVPNMQQPARIGDTQIEAELTVPASLKAETVSLVVVTPAGTTPAYKLFVNTGAAAMAEKEPNDGFAQAQAIGISQVIDGVISQAQDVDVFRFEGQAGQRLVFEVQAARHGSALDSLLTLYDAAGHALAVNDDFGDSLDSRIEMALPQTGAYYLSVMDAHDTGGPVHIYRLVVGPAKRESSKPRSK
jgi:hypothetical protein